MKKIIAALFFLILIGIIAWLLFRKDNTEKAPLDEVPYGSVFPEPGNITSNGGGQTTPLGSVESLPVVRTRDGGAVTVRNFTKDEFVYPVGTSGYSLTDTLSGVEPAYDIFYSSTDGGILVALQQKPLRDARFRAEEELMRYLGVDRDELCDLAISIGVTIDIDQDLAGRELGVSNCNGSVPL